MGASDSIPVVSQAKSATQYYFGDEKGASETQRNFLNTCVVVSQGKSAYEWYQGDSEAARQTQLKYLQGVGGFVDGLPVVGHGKGVVHYALRDKESGDRSMKAASRTAGVLIGGGVGGLTTGPIGAVAGGIAGGATVDGMTTGIESAVEKEYRPSGQIAAMTKMVKGEASPGEYFDSVLGIGFDAIAGYSAGKTAIKIRANRNTSTLYRVGHETEVQNSIETGKVQGPHSEVWLTESKAKAQQFYDTRPFVDKAIMEIQVPKEGIAEIKLNAINQQGYRVAVDGIQKNSRPNMLNTEGISQPGMANIGIKGEGNLAAFNKNVAGIQRHGNTGVKPGAPLVAAGSREKQSEENADLKSNL